MFQRGINIPVDLLVDAYNNLTDESIKGRLYDLIREMKRKDPKAHKAEGFYLDDSGTLYFDDNLYMDAVRRGKIDTYSEAAKEDIKKLLSHLDSVRFNANELEALKPAIPSERLEQRVGISTPIADGNDRLIKLAEKMLELDEFKKLI